MRIAIDFDGTIHDPLNRRKGYKMGQPVDGAIEAVRQLSSRGHWIIIHPTWATTEKQRQAIVDWLTYFNVPYDDITSTKPEADLYVDNNGYRFENWLDTLKFIGGMG